MVLTGFVYGAGVKKFFYGYSGSSNVILCIFAV